ncbi:Sorting nexin mvp1 [Polyrhizophydium stewartii]|uniref:Sorting nexin MVP1 n=1 Tax=Polyrhizophydium stewartii TaxID=2732419 RepID=A0ABR4NCH7_9FUNG
MADDQARVGGIPGATVSTGLLAGQTPDLAASILKASRVQDSLVSNPWGSDSAADLPLPLPRPSQPPLAGSAMPELGGFDPTPFGDPRAGLGAGRGVLGVDAAQQMLKTAASRLQHDPIMQKQRQIMANATSSHSLSYSSGASTPAPELADQDPWQSAQPRTSLASEFAGLAGSAVAPNPAASPFGEVLPQQNLTPIVVRPGAGEPQVGSSVTYDQDESPDAGSSPGADPSGAWPGPPIGRHVTAKASATWSDVLPRVGPHVPLPVEHFELDTIELSVAPERGGFVFKHINYVLVSKLKNSSVLRRYSDFLWLADVLSKRYPFRILPSLPPKKAVGADQVFIEKRRRSLARFMNFVVNHPVFRKDDMVFNFLIWSTDIQSFRNSQAISVEEEFNSLQLSEEMRQSVPLDVAERTKKFQGTIDFRLQQIHSQCAVMEHAAARMQETAQDYERFGAILNKIADQPDEADPDPGHASKAAAEGRHIASAFKNSSQVYQEQALSTLDGLVEGLFAHRDMLHALQELMQRKDRSISGLMIDSVTKRIQQNRAKLNELAHRHSTPRDLERLAHTIDQDQRELEFLKVRAEFIHFCVWSELLLFYRLNDRLSVLYKTHAAREALVHRKQSNIWSLLAGPITATEISFGTPMSVSTSAPPTLAHPESPHLQPRSPF